MFSDDDFEAFKKECDEDCARLLAEMNAEWPDSRLAALWAELEAEWPDSRMEALLAELDVECQGLLASLLGDEPAVFVPLTNLD